MMGRSSGRYARSTNADASGVESDRALRDEPRHPSRNRKQAPQSVDLLIAENEPVRVRTNRHRSVVLTEPEPDPFYATDISAYIVGYMTHVRTDLLEAQERVKRQLSIQATIIDQSLRQITRKQQNCEPAYGVRLHGQVGDDMPSESSPDRLSAERIPRPLYLCVRIFQGKKQRHILHSPSGWPPPGDNVSSRTRVKPTFTTRLTRPRQSVRPGSA